MAGIICHLPGGKGKNVVRPYDPNESNGSWSVVLVVIVPVAQIFVVVVVFLFTYHFYTKYCKPVFCCCFCCHHKSNNNFNDPDSTSKKTTRRKFERVAASETDSGDTCAVPMTTMGASVWHTSVNSLCINGAVPTVADAADGASIASASSQTPNFNCHRKPYRRSVTPPNDTVIECDCIGRRSGDVLHSETVNESGHSREAYFAYNTPNRTMAGTSNHRAMKTSRNDFQYKNNSIEPQVVYRPNEESCVVQCHLPPSSPPPILSSSTPSYFSSNAYPSNQGNYPVSLPSFSPQLHQQVLMRSDAQPCTSRTNNRRKCTVM